MAPLHHHHHLSEFGGSSSTDHIGLNINNYGTINSAPLLGGGITSDDLSFQIGSGNYGGGASLLSMAGLDHQWRLQQAAAAATPQFPFLGGLESSSSGLYQFESTTGVNIEPSGYGGSHHVRPKISSSLATQMASVKMEDNNNNNNQQELNLSRQFSGVLVPGNDQYWGGSAWTDLSNFSSSSTSNPNL